MLSLLSPFKYGPIIMQTQRITSLIALCIMVFLLIASYQRRHSGQKEDRAFHWLIVTVTVFCVLCVIGNFLPLFVDPETAGGWLPVAVTVFSSELPNLFSVLVALCWLVFVDIAVYHSPDSVRRRYAPALIPIPLIIILNLMATLSSLAFWTKGQQTGFGGYIAIAEIIVCLVSMTFYMLYAYRVVHTYQKEMEQPVFLRLDVFIIPWFAAFLIEMLFLASLYPLAHALALLLTFFAMRNRYLYLDEKTGFYNRASMKFLAAHMDKTGYGKGAAILFRTKDAGFEASKLVAAYKPEKSILLQMDGGDYLLFADITRKPVLKLLMDTVEMGAAQASPPIEMKTRSWMRNRDENTDSFIKRVLEESNQA